MDTLPVTDRTRITRIRERQITDRAALHALLDEALIAHVAVVRDGAAIVLPTLFARDGESLLLHGSSGGGLLREAARGSLLSVAVTLVDGLVVARSTFDSSMNYRSAMIIGRASALEGDEKERALDSLVARLLPGRIQEVRASTPREVAATLVLRSRSTKRASRSAPPVPPMTRSRRRGCGPEWCRSSPAHSSPSRRRAPPSASPPR